PGTCRVLHFRFGRQPIAGTLKVVSGKLHALFELWTGSTRKRGTSGRQGCQRSRQQPNAATHQGGHRLSVLNRLVTPLAWRQSFLLAQPVAVGRCLKPVRTNNWTFGGARPFLNFIDPIASVKFPVLLHRYRLGGDGKRPVNSHAMGSFVASSPDFGLGR